jgi:hypothetical protein
MKRAGCEFNAFTRLGLWGAVSEVEQWCTCGRKVAGKGQDESGMERWLTKVPKGVANGRARVCDVLRRSLEERNQKLAVSREEG